MLWETAVVLAASRPASYRGNAVFVRYDTRATTDLAAEELRSLGYPHYAFVHAFGDKFWSHEREASFSDHLHEHGLDCSICHSRASDTHNPLAFQKRLSRFLAELPKPCAVLAAHDPVGRDVLYAAEALGLKVPTDLAVCAIDNNTDVCLSTTPTLSSVFTDLERVGMLVGEAFQQIFNGKRPTDATYRPSALIRRGSTAPLTLSDPAIARAREFIRREIARGLTAADVTAVTGLSTRVAQLRFKKATGRTIMQDIISARIEEARRLLLQGDVPLEGIARLSGWKTLRNFQSAFTRETGCAPAGWRDRQRKL